jgi:quinol monooxygenase YgiN
MAEDLHLVVTTAAVKPGHADALIELFEETNAALVAKQTDWLGAELSYDADTNTVLVIARWKSADSYRLFARSEAFQETMKRFGPHLASTPEVRTYRRRLTMGTLK